MPKRYEGIKKSKMAEGMSEKAAKTAAAKIFNATRKSGEKPVTGHHSRRGKKRK